LLEALDESAILARVWLMAVSASFTWVSAAQSIPLLNTLKTRIWTISLHIVLPLFGQSRIVSSMNTLPYLPKPSIRE
jgi:hypothetical protein